MPHPSSPESDAPFTLALISDLHFGPEARWQGKLRKLTHHAAALTRAFVQEMNEVVRPDMVVNLGDDIEDESREADLARYAECHAILSGLSAPRVNVAGNHDLIHMTKDDLNRFWGREGPLHYSFDRAGWHFVVMSTLEKKDVEVRVPEAQIAWLERDLSRATLPTLVLMHHSVSEQDLSDSRWFAGRAEVALVKERAAIRRVFEQSGKVRAVFNGHVHRNHLDVIAGIPYVTVQSLIENLDEDAPGRPSASYAIVRLTRQRVVVRVRGNDPARYQLELPVSGTE